MSEDPKRAVEHLEALDGELLPDREAMSVLRILPEAPDPVVDADPKTYEISPEDPPPGT
jgi:hypothetical protein